MELTTLISAFSLLAALDTPSDAHRPLKDYVACPYRAPVFVAEAKDRQSSVAFRFVPTAGGNRMVSVIDGWHVLLGTGPETVFVNLKIERSAPGRIERDRDAILESMRMLAQSPDMKAELRTWQRGGLDWIQLDYESLNVGRSIGITTIFDRAQEVIVTGYFFNAPSDKRAFQSVPAYVALRDQVLADVQACLTRRL